MQPTKRAHNGYSNKYINWWQTTRPITRKCSQKTHQILPLTAFALLPRICRRDSLTPTLLANSEVGFKTVCPANAVEAHAVAAAIALYQTLQDTKQQLMRKEEEEEEEEFRGNERASERARELMKRNSSVGNGSGSGTSSGDVFEESEREGGG